MRRRFMLGPTLMADVPAPAPAPRAAFFAGYALLGALARVAGPASLAVVVVDGEGRVVAGAAVNDGDRVIVGRHDQCGMRILDERVSLRHLAVLFRREGDRAVARVWDLNTDQPFVTEDGSEGRAVVADGPIYLRIHGYALWLVPSAIAGAWAGGAEAAWCDLPRPEIIDRRADAMGSAPRRPPRASEYRGAAEMRVALVDRAVTLDDSVDLGVGWGVIRFAGPEGRKEWRVSVERLEQGILVGRYDRCGLVASDLRVSRVHLLLVRIDGDLWAIETASRNGVIRGAERIAARVLGDQEVLVVSKEWIIGWTRTSCGQA